MNKDFIPYEQALELKELGFDEECLAAYYVFGDDKLREGRYGQTESQLFINGIDIQVEDRMEELQMFAYHDVSVPTFSQAFRWFREKYNINGYQFIYQTMDGGYALSSVEEHDQVDGYFEAYEEAELACLNKLIKIVKGGEQ